MLTETVSLSADERAALNTAYDRACEELGLGDGSLDVAKRERVAELILSFVSRGEIDIDVLHRRAVIHCQNTA
jgi:hypothetical protein